MGWNMYDKYLEKCCLCDSNRTEICHKEKLAKRNGLEFSFTQVYIHCHDCGYDFVNKELSSINFENRENSRKEAERLQLLHEAKSLFYEKLPSKLEKGSRRGKTLVSSTIVKNFAHDRSYGNSYKKSGQICEKRTAFITMESMKRESSKKSDTKYHVGNMFEMPASNNSTNFCYM